MNRYWIFLCIIAAVIVVSCDKADEPETKVIVSENHIFNDAINANNYGDCLIDMEAVGLGEYSYGSEQSTAKTYPNKAAAMVGITDCVLMMIEKEKAAVLNVVPIVGDNSMVEAIKLVDERHGVVKALLKEYKEEVAENDTEEIKEVLDEMRKVLGIK